ncbi:uncharacterized protein LOC142337460 isoform X2 [Convolutriloba macropyga]|uniref:uncharacterized protein LOC142337460 isoform X2 n=1 Tax=Convolutriloba macropyga TaxID=536237 RepID=UPI003F51FE97
MPIFISCCYMCRQCVIQLNITKQIHRKDLLIKAFVGLLTAWFVLVTPYVIFQDFVMKGHGYSFATLLEGHYDVLFRTDNWNYVKIDCVWLTSVDYTDAL